jgi:hypothetical protein
VARLKRRHEAISERAGRSKHRNGRTAIAMTAIARGSKMTTLPPGISFPQDAPVNLVNRVEVAVPAGRVSNLATEDSPEERQSQLRSLQQWICELLIKNQQLRSAIMEMKELEPRENGGRNVRASGATAA